MAIEFPSEDEMRAQFWALKDEVEALEAKVKPMRDDYDKLNQDFQKKVAPLIQKIKKAEEPLYELKNKMGRIVRALGGNTGGN